MVHKYSELDLMQARIKEVPKGWSFLPIAKAFKIRNDLRKPISDEIRSTQQGLYPYYGPTKIQDYIDTYEQDGSFALIGEDGDHFLKYRSQSMTQLVDGKCTVNNHAHIIEGTKTASREWFYYYFMHRDIYSYLSRQGAGRYKLNKASLEKIYLLIPPSDEQNKIAQVLSTWDQAISVTEKLLGNSQQQKKALMQQLLTGKKRLLDENGVRFSNDWNKLEIGELLAESRIPSENNDPSKRLTVRLNLKGIQPRACRGTEAVDSTAHFIRSAGQFIYGKQNIHKGAFGIIPYDLNGYETSQDLPAFDFTKKCDPSWFLHYVSQESFYTSLEDKMSGTGSKRLNPKTLFKMKIACPNREEQQKIAAFLSVADQKILVIQKKLDCLKQEKKALMQQLLTGKKRVKVAA